MPLLASLLHTIRGLPVRALGIALFAALPLALLLLFSLSLLPQQPLREHIAQASQNGYLENYPEYLGFREIDMYTECIGMGVATQMQPSLDSLAAMRHFGECQGLNAALGQGLQGQGSPYARYIHGYQLALKPLYTLFPLMEVRLFTALAGLCLLLLLYGAARLRVGERYAAALGFSFLFAGTLHVFLLGTHAPQFWVVLVGGIAAFLSRKATPALLFCGLGLADAFVSFLNMGSLSLGLPLLCFCLAAWADGRKAQDILASALVCCACWSVGLLWLWLAKWGFASLVLPPETGLLGNTVQGYTATGLKMILHALFNNLWNSLYWLWLPLFALLGYRFIKRGLRIPEGLWVLVLPALVPLLWMCLIPGQSGIKHASFVSIIVWPLLAALFMLLLALPRPTPRPRPCWRAWLGLPTGKAEQDSQPTIAEQTAKKA
jgi:hypothetical protein